MQSSFSQLEYGAKKKVARRDRFLGEIEAVTPWSAKNREGRREPEMHQTKKGNEWHFGMKAHMGADAGSGLMHTLVTTPANSADVTQAHGLPHGEVRIALADAGYQGVEKRKENQGSSVDWVVAMGPGKRRAWPDTVPGRRVEHLEHVKARIRAKVEHPFPVIKNILGLKKVRYRGLAKNTAQLFTRFGRTNLVRAKRRLFVLPIQGAP